jgi:regulator of PEP synthase PpsR (kinase-PPPase family)
MSDPVVYVISDSLGETAERVVRAATSQFVEDIFEIRRVPYVITRESVDEALSEAREAGAAVAHTLVVPGLREYLEERARALNIITVDILGPMMGAVGSLTTSAPRLLPGLVHQVDEEYFREVEAVEFAVRYDDGKDTRGILRADVVLIGVSRTSKTPLSMYMAHRGYRVANVPLSPEVVPPEELFNVSRDRVVGLVISPDHLQQIRQERLKALGLSPTANYASMNRIVEEMEYAKEVTDRLGCLVVDVTRRAVEETASQIMAHVTRPKQHGALE